MTKTATEIEWIKSVDISFKIGMPPLAEIVLTRQVEDMDIQPKLNRVRTHGSSKR